VTLPSATTLDKVSITVTWHSDGDFSLPSAPQKVLDKETVIDVQFTETSLSDVILGKDFAECFSSQSNCLR
jgi:hypothetical protein